MLTQTDPNGLTTEYLDDVFGTYKYEKKPDGTETRIVKFLAEPGSPNQAAYYIRTDRSGIAPGITWYDLYDRKLRESAIYFDSSEAFTDYKYSQAGELIQKSLPYFPGTSVLWTSFEFDPVGRVLKEIAPGDRVTQYVYSGLRKEVIDPKGNRSIREENPRGLLLRATDAYDQIVEYKYDSGDHLRELIDPHGNKTEITYDIFGHRSSLQDPDTGITSYLYSPLGELISETASDGTLTNYTYDKIGRVLTQTTEEGVAEWSYDQAEHGVGGISEIRGPQGDREVRFYDPYSRLIRTNLIFEGKTYTEKRSFDSVGRVSKLTYPSGFEVENIYGVAGDLSEVRRADDNSLLWRRIEASPFGTSLKEEFGNGVGTLRSLYPETGLLERIKSGINFGTEVQDLKITQDKLGNVT
ncbi:MAG: RHS repeat protein, partial [Bdellovibrionales bacterium]|nr:RHS repeat protein [Bdellovibrionales bacterium]